MELTDKINKYFSILSKKGYCDTDETLKIFILSFIDDIYEDFKDIMSFEDDAILGDLWNRLCRNSCILSECKNIRLSSK